MFYRKKQTLLVHLKTDHCFLCMKYLFELGNAESEYTNKHKIITKKKLTNFRILINLIINSTGNSFADQNNSLADKRPIERYCCTSF